MFQRVGCPAVQQVVKRDDPVGEERAEAANIAQRENLSRNMHCEIAMIAVVDAGHRDERARSDPRQGRAAVSLAPEQWQRGSDHSRTQNAENCEYALDRIRQLQRHHGICRQSELAQPHCDGCDDQIGLRIGDAARRAIGELLTVRRIAKCDGIRSPRRRAREQIVECRSPAGNGLRIGWFAEGAAEDHGGCIIIGFTVSATRFRGDSRTAK